MNPLYYKHYKNIQVRNGRYFLPITKTSERERERGKGRESTKHPI
jgi:hypothetical protein